MSKIRNGLALYVIAAGAGLLGPAALSGAEEGGGGLGRCSSYELEEGWKHDFYSAHAVVCMSNKHSPTGLVVPGNCQSGNHVDWTGYC